MDPSQLVARLRTLIGSLTRAQRLSLIAAFVAVVLIVGGSALFLNRPDYTLLFADMDAETAADIVARLKAARVPYVLDQGGRAVRVPADRVDELRLELVSEGLPSSGRIGFEIFDRTAFGATEFLEQVNYRRALEGEIARTIRTLSEVANARVHIAMARTSLFASREQPAKASVVLQLKSNRPLSPSTAQGISNLVAASVEGLRPEAVVILDTFGRPLVKPAGEDEPSGGIQLERQQRIERDLTAKVVALLEPVFGPEAVRVNVSARLDPRTEEATEERWDPESPVVRSRQTTGNFTTLAQAQGIAGARANLPPPAGENGAAAKEGEGEGEEDEARAAATPPVVGKGTETTNYEISRVTRHTVRPRGEIARLSVAVIVDNEPVVTKNPDGTETRTTRPRSPEVLQKVQGLVAAAVGLDPERGDQITVENVPFEEPAPEELPVPGVWQRYGPQALEGVRVVGVIVLGVLALLFVVRPLVRRALSGGTEAAGHPQEAPRSVQDVEGEIEAQLDAALAEKTAAHRKLPVLTRRVSALTTKEPAHAARLLRMWMAEDGH